MSSSPRPQTPTTPSPWWSRICRVCWIVLRFFWVTIVIGLALNAIVSLAFFSRERPFNRSPLARARLDAKSPVPDGTYYTCACRTDRTDVVLQPSWGNGTSRADLSEGTH